MLPSTGGSFIADQQLNESTEAKSIKPTLCSSGTSGKRLTEQAEQPSNGEIQLCLFVSRKLV